MKTFHKADCKRVWSRYDMSCARCIELAAGLEPRAGWGDSKKRFEAQRVSAINAHKCSERGCGPVCTFGEW
jgi:hypothetical protein